MKTIGLIGGMSWQSTATYYRLINDETNRQLGGLHSAKLLLESLDFHVIETYQRAGDWQTAANHLVDSASRLQSAGADLLLLCTNTMHKVADQIQAAIQIPLLHIADPTGASIRQAGLTNIGLLGTRFTMEQAFYRERLEQQGLHVHIPSATDREIVDRVIYEELCQGIIQDQSRAEYVRIIEQLRADGAQGVIQGCTEIGLLVDAEHTSVPLFDTTTIHAKAAVTAALQASL